MEGNKFRQSWWWWLRRVLQLAQIVLMILTICMIYTRTKAVETQNVLLRQQNELNMQYLDQLAEILGQVECGP